MFYNFFLNMWIMRKVDAEWIQGQVTKGRIIQKECDAILSTPQLNN